MYYMQTVNAHCMLTYYSILSCFQFFGSSFGVVHICHETGSSGYYLSITAADDNMNSNLITLLAIIGVFVAQIYIFFSVESWEVRIALAIFTIFQIYQKGYKARRGQRKVQQQQQETQKNQ